MNCFLSTMRSSKKRHRLNDEQVAPPAEASSSEYPTKKLRLIRNNSDKRGPLGVLDGILHDRSEEDDKSALELIRDFDSSKSVIATVMNNNNNNLLEEACEKLLRIASLKMGLVASGAVDAFCSLVGQYLGRTNSATGLSPISSLIDRMISGALKYPEMQTVVLKVIERLLAEDLLGSESFCRFQRVADAASNDTFDFAHREAAVHFILTKALMEKDHSGTAEQELCRLTSDRDSRVRKASVQALWRLLSQREENKAKDDDYNDDSGRLRGLETYAVVCRLCADSAENVRLDALRIVAHFAKLLPNCAVSGGESRFQLRLVDDAFSHVCNGVHDLAVEVRARACALLGQFSAVSDTFLEQTLDKKIMSKMKFQTKSGKPMSRRLSGREWSTGKRLGEDVPVEKLDEEMSSMIPSGACGAFVSGLEDEFMVVRTHAVRSLSVLASGRANFASKALDHLSDMFNDEIEQVRLDAINALTPLVAHGQLNADQLETILSVLDDAMSDSRTALRELLSKCLLASTSCVRMAVNALLNNLRRFPEDIDSIWICMHRLGRRHAALVQPFVADLLNLHPFLETTEPRIEDSQYVSKLMLVLNAAFKCPSLCSLLPSYAIRHYKYLRSTHPELVGRLKGLDEASYEKRREFKVNREDRLRDLLQIAYGRLGHADTHLKRDFERSSLLKLIEKDMICLLDGETEFVAPVHFVNGICQVVQNVDTVNRMILTAVDLDAISDIVDETLVILNKLENIFVNVDENVLIYLAETRLRLIVKKMAVEMDEYPLRADTLLTTVLNAVLHFESRVEKLAVRSVSCESGTSLINQLSAFGKEGTGAEHKNLTGRSLLASVNAAAVLHLPETCKRIASITMMTAEINEPDWEKSKEPVKFVAHMIKSVRFVAILRNFNPIALQRLRIKVEYPDSRIQLWKPRTSDTFCLLQETYRLRSRVPLTASLWTDSALVGLGLVLAPSSAEQDRDDFSADQINCAKNCIDIPLSGDCQMPARTRLAIYPRSRC